MCVGFNLRASIYYVSPRWRSQVRLHPPLPLSLLSILTYPHPHPSTHIHTHIHPSPHPTGYVFPTARSISPHLEHPHTGPTSTFCAALAKQLGCYVLAGYPEKLADGEERTGLVLDGEDDDDDGDSNGDRNKNLNAESEGDKEMKKKAKEGMDEHHEEDETEDDDGLAVGANSCVLYDPQGEWVAGYRKTNLYTTDKTWAKAGACRSLFLFSLLSSSPFLSCSFSILSILSILSPFNSSLLLSTNLLYRPP